MILTPLKNFIISTCPEKLDKLSRFRHGWVWLLLTALTAGGAFRLWRHWAEPMISRDGVLYLRQAELWLTGGFQALQGSEAAWIPPLLPWSISRGMLCGLSAYSSGILVNVLAGTLLIAAVFLLTGEFFRDKRLGALAALFCAFVPEFVQLSVEIQRESLYLLFMTLALWLAVCGFRRRNRFYWGGAGTTAFLAALARYEALELFLFIPLFLLGRLWLNAEERRETGWALLLFLLGGAVGGILLSALLGIPLEYYTEALAGRLWGLWS